jgi:flagellin
MPLNSVNTNVGAMIALQNLNSTNTELGVVQARINTGKKVGSAKDNGAVWSIAQAQRSDSMALNSVKDSLQRGISTTDVAIAAGEAVSDLLLQMKEKALAAADTALNTASRKALNEDFKSLRDQIAKVVSNAEFNGANMLKSVGGTSVNALANAKGDSKISITKKNWEYNGTAANSVMGSLNASSSFNTATIAGNLVTTLNNTIAKVSEELTKLGTGSKSLATHLNFVTKLQDSLDAGVGDLVDADLAKESARLQALQTKQQLGIQALSIANGSSGVLLGLFR